MLIWNQTTKENYIGRWAIFFDPILFIYIYIKSAQLPANTQNYKLHSPLRGIQWTFRKKILSENLIEFQKRCRTNTK